MKRALIISIKTAPGLPKEFFLIGNYLKTKGFEVEYLLNSEYKNYLVDAMKEENTIHYVCISKNLIKSYFFEWKKIRGIISDKCKGSKYDYICIYNPHPLAHKVMTYLEKKNNNSIRSVVLHEPFVPYKNRKLYGLRGEIKIAFLDFFTYLLLKSCTDVILPSTYAEKLYTNIAYKVYGLKTHVIPLMLNSVDRERLISDCKYISFVGTINNARNINEIIKVADLVHDRWPDIKFRILTRQNVNIKSKSIEVIKKDYILDSEISDFVQDSLALLLSHTVAAQSGNVPVAYRVGTPIICFDVEGITQQVDMKQTGYIIDEKKIETEIMLAIEYIIKHEDEMRLNCLEYYEKVFSNNNMSKSYNWLDV